MTPAQEYRLEVRGRKWVGCKIEHGNHRSAAGFAPRTVNPSIFSLSSVATISNQRPFRCGSLDSGTYARIHSSFGASAIGRGSGHCGAGRSFDFPVPRAFTLDSASSFCAACSHFTQKFDIPRYSAADPAKTSARKEFRPHAVIRLSIGRNQCVRVLMASPVPACDEGCSSCQ
jgi:hypothetical protein